MAEPCDKCNSGSVHFIRYSGQHLCREHFLDLIRRRVKKEVRNQKILSKGARIGVAVSGGKDSLLVLSLLCELTRSMKDIDVVAITIDEGIEGYRPSSIEIARDLARELGVEWHLRSFDEMYGIPLDRMLERTDLGPCSVCGILRRKALNRASEETDRTILVTGHNLDDMAQTVLMNVMHADIQRLARLGPHTDPIPGFVPRAMPLRTTPENETYLSAYLLGIPLHDMECPYSSTANRGLYRDLVMYAEERTPGTRHSLLRFRDGISSFIPREIVSSQLCVSCSEPVVLVEDGYRICRSCKLLRDIGSEAFGASKGGNAGNEKKET